MDAFSISVTSCPDGLREYRCGSGLCVFRMKKALKRPEEAVHSYVLEVGGLLRSVENSRPDSIAE